MKFAAAATALALLASSAQQVFAHPLDTHEIEASLHERQSGIIVTTGALGTNIYPRYEIHQLINDYPNQFTLFILAMQQWMTGSMSDPTTYAGISTIHGVPRQNYNNVGQCGACSQSIGYCTHQLVLFPAWHRVYLAHFEQQYLKIVHNIANAWPANGRATMQAAAAVHRFPYWDWAAHPPSGLPVFPEVFSDQTLSINTQTGRKTINNPLFRYNFANPSNMYYQYFINWKVTYRWPSNDGVAPASVEGNVINAFNANRQSLQDSVYQLMTLCKDYLHFSNTANNGGATSCTTSLEGIHNTVHTLTGGQPNNTYTAGHMTYLPTASYDPVFWLHHTNVDRLFAFWQTLHPNSYGASQSAPAGTWTIAQGTGLNADSPLTPFYRDTAGHFWTTNEVKNWGQTFKYTYPEYVDSDGSAAAIASYVNKLYGPSATATAGSSIATGSKADVGQSNVAASSSSSSAAASSHTQSSSSSSSSSSGSASSSTATTTSSSAAAASASASSSSAAKSNSGSSGSLIGDLTGDLTGALSHDLTDPLSNLTDSIISAGTTNEYYAIVTYPVFSLGNSYSIHVFDGEPQSEDPFTWTFDPKQIGMIGVPSMSGMTGNKMTATGSVPLTRYLNSVVGTGLLSGLTEELVAPFLTSQMAWRIAGPEGSSLDPETVPGFVVSVVTNTVSQTGDPSVLPSFTDFKPLLDVTKNKAGGANTTNAASPLSNSPANDDPSTCKLKRVVTVDGIVQE